MKFTFKLLEKEFESSSGKTPQFLNFSKVFKKEFKSFLGLAQCKDIVFNVGHFYISGFFTDSKGQPWYFCLNDVRWNKSMYIRRVKNYFDYTGQTNQDVPLDMGIAAFIYNFMEILKLETISYEL